MKVGPLYPKGDLRRMLVVLGVIGALERPTLVSVANWTGLDKKTVSRLIDQAVTQAGVVVEKEGPVYRITAWGPLLREKGVQHAMHGQLGAPSPE